MYAKIYRELFIKDYVLKENVKDNIWRVLVNNDRYYVVVYNDIEETEEFDNYNEAQLLDYAEINNTELRIKANRDFYERLKKYKKTEAYLFRKRNLEKSYINSNLTQLLIFY